MNLARRLDRLEERLPEPVADRGAELRALLAERLDRLAGQVGQAEVTARLERAIARLRNGGAS